MYSDEQQPPEGTFSALMSGSSGKPKNISSERSMKHSDEGTNERSSKQTKQRSPERSNKRSRSRINDRTNERSPEDAYVISIPAKREKTRASFDIFKDQKLALDKLQLACAETGDERPKLGDLVREALDLYFQKKARSMPNVRVERQRGEED